MNKQKGIASIAVIVVLLMVVALPITIKLVQQVQENRSKATVENVCTPNVKECFKNSLNQWYSQTCNSAGIGFVSIIGCGDVGCNTTTGDCNTL